MRKTAGLFASVIICSLALFYHSSLFADIPIETKNFSINVGSDGQWKSIMDKSSGRELCPAGLTVPFAEIFAEGGSIPASGIEKRGNCIQVSFKGSATKLTYSLAQSDDWIHFQLIIVDGPRPERIVLCQVPIVITTNVGSLLNIAWDDQTSACLMAANFQPDCQARERDGYALLRAETQDKPGPPLEGSAVALIINPTPQIRATLRTAAHFFGLLINEDHEGIPSKENMGRQSYWFLTEVKESDAPKIIEYCRKTNINQMMMLFSAWAKSAGHIEYNTENFPDGMESLKRFVKKLNNAGIGVGSHTFVSKVSKEDAYVTPVPDKRFWVDMETALASEINDHDKAIKVKTSLREWPGSPVSSKKTWEGGVTLHQDVTIGDEIIRYESIGPEGAYDTFLGCERGAYGTRRDAHEAGDRAVHWGVDGCINGYIIDQETTLLDEVCDRTAKVFNECGFNMVYFDGGEDVPKDRFMYYASLAQYRALRKFQKKPFIHMGTAKTHRLWHSFTIGSTVDHYLNTLNGAIISGEKIEKWPTAKDHIDRSLRYMLDTRKSMLPGELGWFGIWPKGENTDGLQLNEIEYLMAKALAYDAPLSLETGWSQMDAHPLTPEILNIVGIYERMRMKREVPAALTEKIKEIGKDFAYIKVGAEPEFVEVSEVAKVGGTHDIRSFVGQRQNGDAIATVWHYLGKTVPVRIPYLGNLKVIDLSGKEVPVQKIGGMVSISVGAKRLAIIFPGISKEAAREYLSRVEIM